MTLTRQWSEGRKIDGGYVEQTGVPDDRARMIMGLQENSESQ